MARSSGVELLKVEVVDVDHNKVQLSVSLVISVEDANELEAIGWLVSKLDEA